jgi:hypothetical protein
LKEISMEFRIGKFDASARTVPVTFEHAGVTHKRDVNACLTDAGSYDKKATTARVEEVAQGVAHKIELGVITNPPPEPEAPEASAE